MSARVSAAGVRICLHAAMLSVVDEIGTGGAGAETGCDASTIRRHRSTGDWSLDEICALIAYELQTVRSSRIIDGLVLLLDGPEPPPEPVAAIGEMINAMGESAQMIATASRILSGGITARDLPDLNALKAQAAAAHQRLLKAIVDAQAQASAGRH